MGKDSCVRLLEEMGGGLNFGNIELTKSNSNNFGKLFFFFKKEWKGGGVVMQMSFFMPC